MSLLRQDASWYRVDQIDMWIHDVGLKTYCEYGVTAWLQWQGGNNSEIVSGTLKPTGYVDVSTIQVQ